MTKQAKRRASLLAALDEAVEEAVAFLVDADESLFDGHQTSRQVLSHLLFWHREYARVAAALADGREPDLKYGSYARLNARASREFADASMADMADRLAEQQARLDALLHCLPDWSVEFPIKHGVRFWSVERRLKAIVKHIGHHVGRLERAARHGEAWVRAYYEES